MHECPDLRKYLLSLYDCRYDDFFVQLAKVEQAMKSDRFLNPHYAFYVREMKVRAFAQLTASYRSLTLGKRQTSHIKVLISMSNGIGGDCWGTQNLIA